MLTALEEQVVMGVFTHRTTYIVDLIKSIKNFLPEIQFIIHVQDGPINKNMEALRQKFIDTKKRFWVFLDDDIQFLDENIIHKAVFNLITNKLGLIGVFSTFDPNYDLKSDDLCFMDCSWVPGYFMMVDSFKVGHISPDLNLPCPNTAVDTSYCVSVQKEGFSIGMSPSVVYHVKKNISVDNDAVIKTNAYLKEKWGNFYTNNTLLLNNIVGKF